MNRGAATRVRNRLTTGVIIHLVGFVVTTAPGKRKAFTTLNGLVCSRIFPTPPPQRVWERGREKH